MAVNGPSKSEGASCEVDLLLIVVKHLTYWYHVKCFAIIILYLLLLCS